MIVMLIMREGAASFVRVGHDFSYLIPRVVVHLALCAMCIVQAPIDRCP